MPLPLPAAGLSPSHSHSLGRVAWESGLPGGQQSRDGGGELDRAQRAEAWRHPEGSVKAAGLPTSLASELGSQSVRLRCVSALHLRAPAKYGPGVLCGGSAPGARGWGPPASPASLLSPSPSSSLPPPPLDLRRACRALPTGGGSRVRDPQVATQADLAQVLCPSGWRGRPSRHIRMAGKQRHHRSVWSRGGCQGLNVQCRWGCPGTARTPSVPRVRSGPGLAGRSRRQCLAERGRCGRAAWIWAVG